MLLAIAWELIIILQTIEVGLLLSHIPQLFLQLKYLYNQICQADFGRSHY